jgi:hypothetical protein
MRIELRKHIHLIFYLALSLTILGFLLKPGYILTLDMVFGPSPKSDIYGISGPPAWGGQIWLSSLIQISSSIIPTWVIQKMILVLILFLSGVSAYSLIETKSRVPRYFAGILYMINPFVYARFLAGHWVILLAYAITPFAIKYFLKFLDNPSRQNILKTLVPLVFISVSSHVLILNLLAFLVIFCFKAVELGTRIKRVIPSLLVLALALLAINAYWLLPAATAEDTLLHQITEKDFLVFAPYGGGWTVPFSLATMHGFWNPLYVYARDIVLLSHLFFYFILFLALWGFASNYKDKRVQSFAAIGIISFLLSMGIMGPFKPLFENVWILRGFRDSQKFVALLVLSYAYLGALGLDEVQKRLKTQRVNRSLGVLVVGLLLITPFAYNFVQVGFWGQVKPSHYPEDWYRANEFLNQDEQDFNVLFLPWHAYMGFDFVNNRLKTIVNPSDVFFDKPVIYGNNIDSGGIHTESTNPGQLYLENVWAGENMENLGEKLRPLNVKYVILVKEADYRKYDFLGQQEDLAPVWQSENLIIYKNLREVSRAYQSCDGTFDNAEPLQSEEISPVSYRIAKPDKPYVIFVTPNLDSEHWEMGSKTSENLAPYAVFEVDGGGTIYWRRFEVYELGYIVSIIAALLLAIWYWWGKVRGICRIFRFRHLFKRGQ